MPLESASPDSPDLGPPAVHDWGCSCLHCAMRPEPDPEGPPRTDPGKLLAAPPAGTFGQMADYLREGYWIDSGTRPFHWNLGASGLNANSGVLLYNLSGFSHDGEADADGITDGRKTLVREAFKLFEAVLGIDFEETTSQDTATVDFFFMDNDSGAYAYTLWSGYSGQPGMALRSYINVAEGWSGGTSDYDDYTLQTILHEIGHALGLGHQGYYNGSAGYPGDATFANDSWQASMMSYFAQTENTTVDADYEFLQTPMAVDWMALQDIYGGQSHDGTTFGVQNAFTGDTVYGFNTTITSDVSDIWARFADYADRTASTIVDGGGTDTLDFSGYAADQRIDLRATGREATVPYASDIGGRTGNLTIAEGTMIENAIGGAGADALIGNGTANALSGGEGNDTLTGGAGDDTLTGGAGDDVAVFAGDRAGYTITGTREAATVSGADGTDTLIGIETLRFDDGLWALPEAPPLERIGEAGLLTLAQASADGWTTVTFSEALSDPSVVIGPLGSAEADPATVRVRNVTETGFEVRIEEWGYLDGLHAAETVGWLAVEAGTHELADGTTLRAGSAVAGAGPVTVDLGATFDAAPVALVQVVSAHGADAVATRIDGVTEGGFQVRLQGQESDPAAPPPEVIDWIAVEQGGSAPGGFLAALTGTTIDHVARQVDFGGAFGQAPALLADMQTLIGPDPATLRLDTLDTAGASLLVQEEQSADAETVHAAEAVGLVAVSPGGLSGRTVATAPTVIGEAGTVEIAQTGPAAWTRIAFAHPLDDPSVVMGPLGLNGPDPATIRVRNVTETGFEVQIDEWDYLDGAHAPETVSFLAIEAGSHVLADGTQIRGGSASVDHTPVHVAFDPTDEIPVALSQIVSHAGWQAATTRMRDVTATGFEVRVQEEEANDGLHIPEEVAWIVLTPGSGAGRHVGLTGDVLTQEAQSFGFAGAFSGQATAPALLAAMQSFDGPDPAVVRAASVDASGASLFIEEEASRDSELVHTTELVGIAAFDEGLIVV